MLLDWLVFWDGGFQSVCPPMEKDKRLAQASWWGDWLRGKLGLVLYMFSKSSIQFSVDGWSCVLSLLLTWDQTMVEVIKIMVTSLKRSQACTTTVRAPNPAAGHHWPMPSPDSWTPRGKSPVGSLFLSLGSQCTRFCCVLQESISLSQVPAIEFW